MAWVFFRIPLVSKRSLNRIWKKTTNRGFFLNSIRRVFFWNLTCRILTDFRFFLRFWWFFFKVFSFVLSFHGFFLSSGSLHKQAQTGNTILGPRANEAQHHDFFSREFLGQNPWARGPTRLNIIISSLGNSYLPWQYQHKACCDLYECDSSYASHLYYPLRGSSFAAHACACVRARATQLHNARQN